MKSLQTHEGMSAKHRWLGLVVGGILLVILSSVAGWYAWQRTRPQQVVQAPLDAKTATPSTATKDSDLQKDLDDITRNLEGYDSEDKNFTRSIDEKEPQIHE